jgi:hypothetical protein
MTKSLAKVEGKGLWRNHLQVKSHSSTPSADEYDVWQSRASGLSIQDTAEHYGITESTVKAYCSKVEKFFETNVAIDIAGLKITQHMRIEAMIEAALSEFQSSGGVVRSVVKKVLPGEDGDDPVVIEETITEKTVCRDPRFLTNALNAMQEQRKIWPGANAPSASTIKHEETKTSNINIDAIVKNMTPEDAAALARLENVLASQDAIDADFTVNE